jgi:hypothetical protein
VNNPTSKSAELAWLAESLRFTAFPVAEQVNTPTVFGRVAGAEPEEEIKRPALGLRQEHGPYLGKRLTIVQQRAQTDLVLSMSPASPEALQYGFVTIGDLNEAIVHFEKAVVTWLESAPEVKRVALGLILLLPFESTPEAYRVLRSLLPLVDFDPNTESDVIWQINRPRNTNTEPKFTLNRLSNWRIIEVVSVQVSGTTPPRAAGPAIPLLRLELDINTSASRTEPIGKSSLTTLWGELRKAALDISRLGDIR